MADRLVERYVIDDHYIGLSQKAGTNAYVEIDNRPKYSRS